MLINSYKPTPAVQYFVEPGEYWAILYRYEGENKLIRSGDYEWIQEKEKGEAKEDVFNRIHLNLPKEIKILKIEKRIYNYTSC